MAVHQTIAERHAEVSAGSARRGGPLRYTTETITAVLAGASAPEPGSAEDGGGGRPRGTREIFVESDGLVTDGREPDAMTRFQTDWGPLVVGGIGGSGTRVVAQILIELGFYLGADLNLSCDNLWFTLLFRRRRWFAAAPAGVATESRRACDLLRRAMHGEPLNSADLRFAGAAVAELPANPVSGVPGNRGPDNAHYDSEWGQARLVTLRDAHRLAPSHALGWGWKEPNTHVFLPELTRAFDAMRFVLVMRHGLDMAFSHNQQQLFNWGGRYGVAPPRGPDDVARQSLAFWVAANQRAIDWGDEHLGERFFLLRYEELCHRPQNEIARLCDFVGQRPAPELLNRLVALLRTPSSIGRFRAEDLGTLEDAHLDAVRRLGFDT